MVIHNVKPEQNELAINSQCNHFTHNVVIITKLNCGITFFSSLDMSLKKEEDMYKKIPSTEKVKKEKERKWPIQNTAQTVTQSDACMLLTESKQGVHFYSVWIYLLREGLCETTC